MKPAFLACALALLAAPTGRATPAELALAAAMKLPDASNYAWTTSVDDDARSYTIEGQTDRVSDLSLVRMPLVAALRRQAETGTANSDNVSTVIFQGDEKFVVEVESKWKTPDELKEPPPPEPSEVDFGLRGGIGARNSRGAAGFPGNRRKRERPLYSNLQKTLSRPHDEVGIIVATASDLQMDGAVVSGKLSETAARLLLVHPGQPEIFPLRAAGTFRFWLRNGTLAKYEVKLEGTLAVTVRGDHQEVEVHQTALTEIKDVGTTRFEVPDEAMKKLKG